MNYQATWTRFFLRDLNAICGNAVCGDATEGQRTAAWYAARICDGLRDRDDYTYFDAQQDIAAHIEKRSAFRRAEYIEAREILSAAFLAASDGARAVQQHARIMQGCWGR